MSILDMIFEIFIIFGYLNRSLSTSSGSTGILKSDQKHRTQKAAEKANELFCYKCETMDVTQGYCMNVSEHKIELQSKCEEDRRICMVKKVSFLSSSENQTITHKTWSLERSCANRCDPGCLVIGERNKIYVCRTCCENSLCNTGTAASAKITINGFLIIFCLVFIFFFQYN